MTDAALPRLRSILSEYCSPKVVEAILEEVTEEPANDNHVPQHVLDAANAAYLERFGDVSES